MSHGGPKKSHEDDSRAGMTSMQACAILKVINIILYSA